MKKTLFVKFLFLLLCGSVLTTAGCKDYDDDIDALRNDVEDLKGAVVEPQRFRESYCGVGTDPGRFRSDRFFRVCEKERYFFVANPDRRMCQRQRSGCEDRRSDRIFTRRRGLAGEPEQSEIGYSGRNSGYLRYPGNTGERSGNAGKYD